MSSYHARKLIYSGHGGLARGIARIATLDRVVVYCSCEQIISAAPPGAAQRAQGIAQAVTPWPNRIRRERCNVHHDCASLASDRLWGFRWVGYYGALATSIG